MQEVRKPACAKTGLALLPLAILFLLSSGCVTTPPASWRPDSHKETFFPPMPRGYSLGPTPIFSDEFDSGRLDPGKWNVNDRLRYAVKNGEEALSFTEDTLKISFYKDPADGLYHTGYITTWGENQDEDHLSEQRFFHSYGYYTARVRLKTSPGTWCAFWLMNREACQKPGQGSGEYGPQDGAEIDIMEYVASSSSPAWDRLVYTTEHWDYGEEATHGRVTKNWLLTRKAASGWMVFSFLWTPESYQFYINDRLVWTLKDEPGKKVLSHEPCDLRLSMESLAGSGSPSWAGEVDDKALPDCFEVDYVRVYDLFRDGKAVE